MFRMSVSLTLFCCFKFLSKLDLTLVEEMVEASAVEANKRHLVFDIEGGEEADIVGRYESDQTDRQNLEGSPPKVSQLLLGQTVAELVLLMSFLYYLLTEFAFRIVRY